jgi:amino acid adenylation domain-containing protein
MSASTLSERELDLVTRAWNRTEVPRPDLLLHQPFAAWARRTPDAVAVEQEGRTLTYAELDRRAGRLAGALRALGVGPEVIVALACERSPETMTGLLAVLEAGGAYVPVDVEAPPARQAEVLRDSGARVVLTLRRLRPVVPAPPGVPVLCLDEPPPEAVAGGPPARPANLAYLIYTSGSTGRPKGVLNQHGPVCNRLLWMLDHHPLRPGDAVLQKTPLHFDVSAWEMLWPLSSGARLVLARPGGHRDAAYLVRTVAESRVTALHFVPSMLAAFLERPDLADCADLTRVYCSGEALTPALRDRVFERLPAVELHNLYGPTEAAIEVSHWRCRPHDGPGGVPIGRPLANCRLYVLDGGLEPVPIDAPGELCIGGLPVARGYHGRPGLTADCFRPDPFGAPGARLYRTGDRARFREDGNVEFLGRLDTQVKVRGYRIELGEIETALREHPRVHDAVVTVQELAEHDRRLIAYVVTRDGEEADDLRAWLAGRLPGYMVPAVYVPLAGLPLTPSGKTDRRALPAPPERARADRRAPASAVERRVAAIWAELLRVREPDLRDSFVQLGGDSLLAGRVIGRINAEFGVELSVQRMFDAATLGELSAAVAEELARPAVPPHPDTRPPGRREHPGGREDRLLERIDQMTDEEVQRLLAQLQAERSAGEG